MTIPDMRTLARELTDKQWALVFSTDVHAVEMWELLGGLDDDDRTAMRDYARRQAKGTSADVLAEMRSAKIRTHLVFKLSSLGSAVLRVIEADHA